MNSDEDVLLKELRLTLDPIITRIDEDEMTERAVFVVGARDVTDADGETIEVETYIDAAGDHGLIQEALYAELMGLIENGEPDLFEAIRQVIHQIEEEKDLSAGETLQLSHPARVLH